MSVILKGLKSIGGRWWECVLCGGTVAADCACCEPPACNCRRLEKRVEA